MKVIDGFNGRYAFNDEQRLCLAARLDRNPALLAALAQDPLDPSKQGEVSALVGQCINATTIAREFAANVAEQAGNLSTEQITCLRDGYAELTPEQLDQMVRAALNPGTVDSAAVGIVEGILTECGVDPGLLKPG